MKKQNRREFVKVLGGVAALSFIPSMLFANNSSGSKVKLTILSTNDVHSRIEPFAPNDKKYANQGGFAQRAAIINDIRSKEENVLLLDAGDIFQGTPYFNIYNGVPELQLMSKMGYDAATMGNHDFDIGLDGFKKAQKYAEFPYICSNYDFSDTILKDKTIPYKIIDKGNLRIGIIGVGVELKGLVSEKNYGKTKYIDPIATVNKYAKLLKEKSCDFIICLSHLGIDYPEYKNQIGDVELAKSTSNVDYIIGGHTHTFMDEAMELKNLDGDIVRISHSGFGGLLLGRLDVEFDVKNNEVSVSPYTTKKVEKQ